MLRADVEVKSSDGRVQTAGYGELCESRLVGAGVGPPAGRVHGVRGGKGRARKRGLEQSLVSHASPHMGGGNHRLHGSSYPGVNGHCHLRSCFLARFNLRKRLGVGG